MHLSRCTNPNLFLVEGRSLPAMGIVTCRNVYSNPRKATMFLWTRKPQGSDDRPLCGASRAITSSDLQEAAVQRPPTDHRQSTVVPLSGKTDVEIQRSLNPNREGGARLQSL